MTAKLYGNAQDLKYPQLELYGFPYPFAFSYQVADLAAGADIAATAIFVVPAGKKFVVQSANVISQGSAAGVDASNTCAVAVKKGTTTLASKTFDDAVAFPAAGEAAALTLGTALTLAAGDVVTYAVTNGATANPPGFVVQVNGILTDA